MATNDNNNSQISAPEAVPPTVANQPEANAETSKGTSQTSVFVNSEPIREDQVQNAVQFLSHPKVRGSAVMYRRSFLERKGLTKEEIDEAFRRVPDPSPTVSAAQPTTTTPDSQMNPVSNVQPQVSSQNLQSSLAAANGNPNRGMILRSQFHWYHALAAIGLLAISGAGTAVIFKRSIVPRLKTWIRKVVFEEEEAAKKISGKPSLEEEAAAAAKAAAAAAADVARASQEMLISKSEDRKYFEELMSLVGMQVQEMKSMSNSIRKLEGNTTGRVPFVEQEQRVSVSNSRANVNGITDYYSARSSPPPSNPQPSAAPHSQSYMEIMSMVQRGEKPSNIREINDMPPNPNQPLPTPQLAPRPKPWEVGQTQSSFTQSIQYNESSNGVNYNINDNGFVNQTNGDREVPWWQMKNPRISEIENENEVKTVSSKVTTTTRPVQRSWVPPQAPPVAMPEAAAAIRQPKKPLSQNSLTDEQLLGGDELQRITKISEAGGALETNGLNSDVSTKPSESRGQVSTDGGNSGLNISEIQEEQVAY